MIGIKQAKAAFFDTAIVRDSMDRKTNRVLARFGAFVRRTSRNSIRSSPNVSKPGQPPRSHVGTLKRFIFFTFEPRTRSVVIGPARTKPGNAAEVIEYGGNGFVKRKSGTKSATFQARPFMTPAFIAEQKTLPQLWATVKG